MSQVHEYKASVVWQGGRDGAGTVSAASGASSPLSVPTEFGGPGQGTNPEELLTEAIAACYSVTFGIIAANRKLPFASMTTEAVGEVEQQGMNFKYRKITIRPTISLSADASPDHEAAAHDMAHKADGYCIITNAVRGNVEIVVEPTIVRA